MTSPAEPELHVVGTESTRAVLAWRFDRPVASLSSAPVGGGWRTIRWILNIGVPADYSRHDLDAHADELTAGLHLAGTGVAHLTAIDVANVVRAHDELVTVDATVGATKPTWAADVDGAFAVDAGGAWVPGTINIVAHLPVALTPAAAVNAVITVTEAKAQALIEAGIPGTGTASDAVTVLWPTSGGADPFCGPRSDLGSRLARAVHRAVHDGLARTPGGLP